MVNAEKKRRGISILWGTPKQFTIKTSALDCRCSNSEGVESHLLALKKNLSLWWCIGLGMTAIAVKPYHLGDPLLSIPVYQGEAGDEWRSGLLCCALQTSKHPFSLGRSQQPLDIHELLNNITNRWNDFPPSYIFTVDKKKLPKQDSNDCLNSALLGFLICLSFLSVYYFLLIEFSCYF